MSTAVYIFPCLMMVFNLGAAVFYGFAGNWKMSVYWLAAMVINATVTF